MLSVRDVGYSYPGADRPAVAGLGFDIGAGEVFGFLGPSGAGKSTTQKILTGLIRGYSGGVEFEGRELKDWSRDFFERIGVSFEHPTHFLKLTARENLAYFGSLYAGAKEPVEALLEKVGLAADADRRVETFSKGMKNRLSVARALLHRPPALFLDEPTAGLDPASARTVRDLIGEQKRAGRAVFLTTHDMAVADALCDRVAFIVDGRLATVDAPRDLKLKHGKALVQVETREAGGIARRAFPLAGLGGNGDFQEILRGGRVESIHTQEATLEDVFLQVTGRGLA